MKVTLKSLFTTFIFSAILGIAVNSIYYFISQRQNGYDYGHLLPLMAEGVLFMNIIAIIMSLPALFLNNPLYSNTRWIRLLLYFLGPVLLIATIIWRPLGESDKIFYLITGFIFLIVHAVYYRKAFKNKV